MRWLMVHRPPPAPAAVAARLAVIVLAALAAMPGAAQDVVVPAATLNAAALRAKETALHDQLLDNAFGRPLALTSTATDDDLQGDVYALVDQPYALVDRGLSKAGQWCDVLTLHLNVKGCSWRVDGADTHLLLAVGRKFDQPLSDAYKIDFGFRLVTDTPDYLQVRLDAAEGPMGTRNYRLAFEAVPLDAKSSFVHMSYAYGVGTLARLAMQTYLGTVGHDKVGFSVVGRNDDGTPVYIGDMRGLIERNAMRYYLAIEAYLRTSTLPADEQVEQRIERWFDATERYPRQLHEMGRDEYLTMKRKEIAARQAPVPKPN